MMVNFLDMLVFTCFHGSYSYNVSLKLKVASLWVRICYKRYKIQPDFATMSRGNSFPLDPLVFCFLSQVKLSETLMEIQKKR